MFDGLDVSVTLDCEFTGGAPHTEGNPKARPAYENAPYCQKMHLTVQKMHLTVKKMHLTVQKCTLLSTIAPCRKKKHLCTRICTLLSGIAPKCKENARNLSKFVEKNVENLLEIVENW